MNLRYLEVKAVSDYGAFLDWGLLAKDLFVPFREQAVKMYVGNSYLVRIVSRRERLTELLHLPAGIDFWKKNAIHLKENEEVEIKIASQTDLGYKVIVNDTWWGVLYENEIFQPISIGETQTAYVKKLREDHRLDIILKKQGVEEVEHSRNDILSKLKG